ncbi:MAG: mycothiol synthase [Acidimicrobiaceae bacterium]|nr:mycothiol synthase [Acidimicrobiaceae bacterium]MDQ1445234.1 mycothiol synthase [Acidimicrobiaceae bacterium]
MGKGDIAAVHELLEVAEAADGHQPLGEHQWLDLVHGGREGFAGLVAWEPGHPHPVGYAQVTRGDGPEPTWALEFVVDPHHRDDGCPIGHDLVRSALGVVASEGGGHVHLWVSKPAPDDDAIAQANGLRRGRDLLQMRRPLPVEGAAVELDTRPFVVGQDEDDWLVVNNRAFAWHPEQGGWSRETLARRQAEPWFDPAGFLLFEVGGRLAGYCWTKVHADHDPPLGEIYVIATDPDFQGQGLGRKLVLAGLAHLAAKGVAVGMLYVDASNTAAVGLYESLGFTVDHVDRAYTIDVTPLAPVAAVAAEVPAPTARPIR